VYELDLRNKEWGRDPAKGQKRTMTVFCPADPGWPDGGRTTDEFAVAEAWVRSHYVPFLQQGNALARAGGVATLRVREAVDRYLDHLEAELGADHNTVANRRSVCRVHVVPLLGSRPLAALTREVVRDFLENLQAVQREGGRAVRRPAKLRTRTNARDALTAVWRHACPEEDPPFAGVRLTDREVAKQRRIAAREGRIEELIEPNVYTREQVVDILAAAMWYDRELIAGRPNVAVRVLPNTAETIALQLGTAARIEEETALRWLCFRWSLEAAFIPGTKSFNAARWVPLQRSLLPWLERLRALQGGSPDPDSFVVQTHPAHPFTQASKKTYQARIARVLRLAGLKLPRKCTHIFTRDAPVVGVDADSRPGAPGLCGAQQPAWGRDGRLRHPAPAVHAGRAPRVHRPAQPRGDRGEAHLVLPLKRHTLVVALTSLIVVYGCTAPSRWA
jgi:integrase